ncbi:hypothetical protein GQ43DRAFT_387214 [Delitschia confertaspora ATCC 74209]|uniref:DUF1279 domain-containing protein n=1 Tax=Delitschia confertaspora ATCC 74209 TaxID=1513339 RepID=A0A9P4N2F8_9PLEO|nr:hypothetical protein GQ43DRAFT_387214 [Delitschia confertaspora ATCC 74209]
MRAGRAPSSNLLFQGLAFRNTASALRAPVLRRFFTPPQRPLPKSKPASTVSRTSTIFSAGFRNSFLSRYFRVRFNSTKPSQTPNPTPNLGSAEPASSLSQRLKKLSREYGWTALGVYLALSALDFPFCFLAVRMLGTDRIGHYEHVVIESFWKVVQIPFPNLGPKKNVDKSMTGEAQASMPEDQLGWSGDVNEAAKANKGADASLWTQLALAYAIHKSFIFIRVPLTAAVLPKVVKQLRKWGFDVGKRKPKST